MFYYVYVLKRRLEKHNAGKSLATKPFKPYRLIYYEAFLSKYDAKNREEYLKTGWGWRSLKKMLKGYLEKEGGQDGNALVLKTSWRKPEQVRLLYPPQRNKFARRI